MAVRRSHRFLVFVRGEELETLDGADLDLGSVDYGDGLRLSWLHLFSRILTGTQFSEVWIFGSRSAHAAASPLTTSQSSPNSSEVKPARSPVVIAGPTAHFSNKSLADTPPAPH